MSLKVFVFFSILSSGGHFFQRSGTTFAILVEGYPRNIPVKLFLKKGKRKVQGVPQTYTAALPRPQEGEDTDKS